MKYSFVDEKTHMKFMWSGGAPDTIHCISPGYGETTPRSDLTARLKNYRMHSHKSVYEFVFHNHPLKVTIEQGIAWGLLSWLESLPR